MVLRILVLWLLLCYSYSKADVCLPNHEGLCEPGVTIIEDVEIDVTEEDLGTEIVTTTTTTTMTTTMPLPTTTIIDPIKTTPLAITSTMTTSGFTTTTKSMFFKEASKGT